MDAIYIVYIVVYQLLARAVEIRSCTWWHFLHNGLRVHLVIDGIKILYADLIVNFEVLRPSLHLNIRQNGRLRAHIHLSVFRSIVVIDIFGHGAVRVHGVRWHDLYH